MKYILLFVLLAVCEAWADPILFRFSPEKADTLRRFDVSWDEVEVGAPCLRSGPDYSEEHLHGLQIALLYGELAEGEYLYEKPADVVTSPLVERLPSPSRFRFTGEHRELLKHMALELEQDWDTEELRPGVDPKRPYGAFTYYQAEMAMHLGREVKKNDRGEVIISMEVEEEMTELHYAMQAALQVFLRNFKLEPAEFKGDEYGNWERASRP